MDEITMIAAQAYSLALSVGCTRRQAAQSAWLRLRALAPTGSYPRRSRAQYWDECVGDMNTSRRRNFRSPLATAIGHQSRCVGQYCTDWRRPARSEREVANLAEATLDALDALIGR